MRKKPRTKPRRLLPLQRLIIAKEIISGKPMKQIAEDWHTTIATVQRIFHKHLEYKIVWKGTHSEEA